MKFNIRRIKLNVMFNCLGGGWQGLLTLIATPFQVYFLGVEAFGIIGFLALLQVIINNIDFGLSATVTKLMANDSSQEGRSHQSLVSMHVLYWFIACLMLLIMLLNSGSITNIWSNNLISIEREELEESIILISYFLGIRYPVGFYASVLNGLQWMGMQNILKIGIQTLRLGGGLCVLAFMPSIDALLYWYCLTAALEVGVYVVTLKRKVPWLFRIKYFSYQSMTQQWRYSLGMYMLSLTGLVLGQCERISVSRMLSLEDLGIYSIAYSVSIFVSLIQISVNSASFSALANGLDNNNQHVNQDFIKCYDYIIGLMITLVAFPCMAVILYSHDILEVWINEDVANQASFCMSILSIGFFFAAIVSSAYTLAVSSGNPRFPLYANVAAIFWYLPLVYFLVGEYGINGASVCWLALNFYYIFTIVPIVELRITKRRFLIWLKLTFGVNFLYPILLVVASKVLTLVLDLKGFNAFIPLVFVALIYMTSVYKKLVGVEVLRY